MPEQKWDQYSGGSGWGPSVDALAVSTSHTRPVPGSDRTEYRMAVKNAATDAEDAFSSPASQQ